MPFEGVRERSDESKLRAVHRYAGRSSRFLRVADEASVFKYASSLLEQKKAFEAGCGDRLSIARL